MAVRITSGVGKELGSILHNKRSVRNSLQHRKEDELL
jgi:hypothetical protein